eukprot:5977593-Amphidinium_carterae.1
MPEQHLGDPVLPSDDAGTGNGSRIQPITCEGRETRFLRQRPIAEQHFTSPLLLVHCHNVLLTMSSGDMLFILANT